MYCIPLVRSFPSFAPLSVRKYASQPKFWNSLCLRSHNSSHVAQGLLSFETNTRRFLCISSARFDKSHSSDGGKGSGDEASRKKRKSEQSEEERQVRAEFKKQLRSRRIFEDEEEYLDLDTYHTQRKDSDKLKEKESSSDVESERKENDYSLSEGELFIVEKKLKEQQKLNLEPFRMKNIRDLRHRESKDNVSHRQVKTELQITPDMFEYHPPRCPGCGAFFQSQDTSEPGFVAKASNPNKTKKLFTEENRQVTCKRCFDAKYYNKPSFVKTSNEDIAKQLSFIERKKGLIIYVVNVMDINGSMFPQLLQIVGESKRLLIIGNKVDMLPINETPGGQADKIKNAIVTACLENGLSQESNIRNVLLVSAKTGFGLHQLTNAIQENWDNNGDVYLMGCTNVGKTTLFNLMLDLLSAHKRKGDMLNRATVSLWPGMTLSLVRFPFSYFRLVRLRDRLLKGPQKFYERTHPIDEEIGFNSDISNQRKGSRHGSGSLFSKHVKSKEVEIEIDPAIIDVSQTSIKKYVDDSVQKRALVPRSQINISSNLQVYKPEFVKLGKEDDSRNKQAWFYDTPGMINDNQIYPLLTMEELKLLHPGQWLVPRTYILKPGQTMLIGGLARLDYLDIKRKPEMTSPTQDPDDILEANRSAFFTILASPNLPLHILGTHKADDLYAKHAGEELLGIPMGGKERMEKFPPLESREFVIDGLDWWDSSADITLSSIGWVAVATGQKYKVLVRAFTPQARGLELRQPAMLPTIIRQRGQRGVKYQGFIDYTGYQATRAFSPSWDKYMAQGNEGTYEWVKECKLRVKEQQGEMKLLKLEEVCRKSLEGMPNFVTRNYPKKNKKIESGEKDVLQVETTAVQQ